MSHIYRIILLAVITFFSGFTSAEDAKDQGNEDITLTDRTPWWSKEIPHYNSVLIEKIVNLKTWGDELYRYGDISNRELAGEKYHEAHNEIRKIVLSDMDDLQKKVFDLLVAEINYRMFIADNSLDFFSGTSARIPRSPKYRMNRFKQRYDIFSELINGIDENIDNITDKTIKSSNNISSLKKFASEITITYNESEQNIAKEENAQDGINNARAEINRIRANRARWESESKSLTAELENTAEQATQIGTSLAVSALGVPEAELLQGDKTLEDRIQSYALQKAGDAVFNAIKDSEKIKALQKEYKGVLDQVDKIKKNVEKVEGYVDTVKSVEKFIDAPSTDAFLSLSTELAEDYGNKDSQEFINLSKQVHETIKNPSIENLLSQSDLVWSKLDTKDQKLIKAQIDKVKPFENLIKVGIEISKSSQKEKEILDIVLNNIPDDAKDNLMYKLVDDYKSNKLDINKLENDYKAKFNDLKKDFNGLGNELIQSLINTSFVTASDNWNNILKQTENVDVLLEKICKKRIDTDICNGDTDALVNAVLNRLAEDAKAGKGVLKEIKGSGVSVEINKKNVILGWKIARENFELKIPSSEFFKGVSSFNEVIKSFDGTKLYDEAVNLIGHVTGQSNDVLGILLDNKNIDQLNKILDLSNIKLDEKQWKNVKDEVSGIVNVKNISNKLGAVAATSLINKAIMNNDAPIGATPIPLNTIRKNPSKSSGGDVNKEEAMAMAAIGMAFPGVAMAQAALNLLGSLKEMSRLAKKINRISDQIASSFPKEVSLINQIESSNLSLHLLAHEREINFARKAAAEAQLEAAEMSISLIGQGIKKERREIALKKSILFFYIEMMRQEFDMLEQSLATLTHGKRGKFKDEIMKRLKADPDYNRLALDPDIGLYNWLDRENERVRIDLTKIKDHWQRMITIASEVCDSYCGPDGINTGEINRNLSIKLTDLMDEGLKTKFDNWKIERNGSDFKELVPFLPYSKLDFNDDAYNIRIISIAAAGCSNDSCNQALNRFSILHSGSSIIKTDDGLITTEWLPPQQQSAFNTTLNPSKELWGSFDDLSSEQQKLMGYGLFSPLEFRIEPSESNYALDDIEIKIAYYFRRLSDPPDPIGSFFGDYTAKDVPLFEVIVENDGTQHVISNQVLMSLGPLSGVRKMMRKWGNAIATENSSSLLNPVNNVSIENIPQFKLRPVCKDILDDFNGTNDDAMSLTTDDVQYFDQITGELIKGNDALVKQAQAGNADRIEQWKGDQILIIEKSYDIDIIANASCPQHMAKSFNTRIENIKKLKAQKESSI